MKVYKVLVIANVGSEIKYLEPMELPDNTVFKSEEEAETWAENIGYEPGEDTIIKEIEINSEEGNYHFYEDSDMIEY